MEGRHAVIELTRLNGHPLVINAELIKFVEQNPDTVITLVTGDKMVVREATPEVMRRVLAYRRNLLFPAPPPSCPDPGHDDSQPRSQE
jgi:flagellar protein FlbD